MSVLERSRKLERRLRIGAPSLGFQNPASNDTHELLLVLVSRTFQRRLTTINPGHKKTCGLRPRRLCGVLSDLPECYMVENARSRSHNCAGRRQAMGLKRVTSSRYLAGATPSRKLSLDQGRPCMATLRNGGISMHHSSILA